MENRVIEGLIVKVMPYLESNRLLYTYTPLGKVTLHAKGAQKMTSQLRVASQYLTHIEADFVKKEGLIPVSQLKIVNDFQSIKSNFDSMSEVALLLELIQQCIGEDAPHQSIFKDLMIVLNSLYLKELSLRFIIRILHVIGYDLNLTGDGQDVIGFHIPTASLLLQLKYTNYDTIFTISDTQLKSIKSFLIDYIEYHVHIKIKNR